MNELHMKSTDIVLFLKTKIIYDRYDIVYLLTSIGNAKA